MISLQFYYFFTHFFILLLVIIFFIAEWSLKLKSLWSCNWSETLANDLLGEILTKNFTGVDLSSYDNETLLVLAISSLQAFVQQNFVGPPLKLDIEFTELPWRSVVEKIGENPIREYLCSNSVEINVNVGYLELLAFAKYIFLHLNERMETCDNLVERFVCQHWLLRYYGIHQLVIDENTDSLYSGILQTVEKLVENFDALDGIDQATKVICLLEITALLLHYKSINRAKEKLQTAQRMLNVLITIEGKLGVRTKYQTKPLPQLLLRVDSDDPSSVVEEPTTTAPPIDSPMSAVDLPRLLQLDDDVRLEKIKFVAEEDNSILRMKSIIQVLILATLLV